MKIEDKIYIAVYKRFVGSIKGSASKPRKSLHPAYRDATEPYSKNRCYSPKKTKEEKPIFVFSAPGMNASDANNRSQVNFVYDHLVMALNAIHAAFTPRLNNLSLKGNSFVYGKTGFTALKEKYFLTPPLEPANMLCTIAKIPSRKLRKTVSQQYRASLIGALPGKLYGINDTFTNDTFTCFTGTYPGFHE